MKDSSERPKKTAARAAREKRLAQALRANLKRRKAVARREDPGAASGDKANQQRS